MLIEKIIGKPIINEINFKDFQYNYTIDELLNAMLLNKKLIFNLNNYDFIDSCSIEFIGMSRGGSKCINIVVSNQIGDYFIENYPLCEGVFLKCNLCYAEIKKG